MGGMWDFGGERNTCADLEVELGTVITDVSRVRSFLIFTVKQYDIS
jgi:hypothetical protein